MAKTKSDLATIAAVAQLLAVVLTVAALFFARDVFIPLALGLLLSFLLTPIVDRLQRWGIPNIPAVVITAAFAFVLLAGTFTLLGRELTNLVGDLPTHKDELVSKARSIAGMTTGMGGELDNLADEVTQAMVKDADPRQEATDQIAEDQTIFQQWTDKLLPTKVAPSDLPNDGTTAKSPLYVQSVEEALPLASWASTAGTLLGPLATAGLVTVFALFMLIHREDLRDRMIAVVSHGNYVTTTEALDEAAGRISRYLVAQTIINTSYGFVLAIGLSIIGLTMTEDGAFPNAILWGVLATCLRFVPYLGPTAAAIFPSAIALSVFPGYSVFLAVVALITTLELVSNNVIEPWLYGTSTGISAVAVIVAAVFWGWLWGPVGLLLSTPLTVCLVVLGRYVPRFKIIATLLGEDVEIKPSIRFYQRLLAFDEHRAHEILFDHFEAEGLEEACDDVVLPALKRIRTDHDAENLSDSDADRLFEMVAGMIPELDDRVSLALRSQLDAEEPTETPSVEPQSRIIGTNSHHHSETLVLKLLRLGGRAYYQLDGVEDDMMPQEIARMIADAKPLAVVIAVLPKGGFVQARYLCKAIRSEGYSGAVVIACLGKFKNFDKLFVKFRKAGATAMTTSYSQTHSKLVSITQRHARQTSTSFPQPQTTS
ncbi:transport protein [Rhodopirellula islandica]|uniref:Transport protein n=1 Tax=Rhodopirellula islandica TaxID=595434 RepID=A0A0J1BGZ7_RHOIS|nr:AI-2E family transporter [Rhodopirellula islandica]KLU05796.1 transport protein [Rhodopirellula islandica]